MKDTELQRRLQSLGMDQGKARELTRKIRDELHPAAATATILIGEGAPGMGADVKTTASLASAGAKVGSIIPGVGTAIGAAVGVVAGLLMHKGKKPERAADAAKVMADLAAFPDNISGGQVPWETFGHLFYGIIINQGMFDWQKSNPKNHPSAMDNIYYWSRDMTKQAIAAGLKAGPGQMVSVPIVAPNGPRFTFSYRSPTSLDQTAWNDACTMPLFIMWVSQTNPANLAQRDAQKPLIRKTYKLMTGRILTDLVPAAAPSPSTQIAQTGTAVVRPAIVNQAAQIAAQIRAGGVVPQLVTPPPSAAPTSSWNQASAPQTYQSVIPYGGSASYAPTPTTLPPSADATAGILQTLLSMQQGNSQANFVSPAAQNILADVAAEGVQQTPQGPSSLPPWALPAGIAAAGLLLFTLMRRK